MIPTTGVLGEDFLFLDGGGVGGFVHQITDRYLLALLDIQQFVE